STRRGLRGRLAGQVRGHAASRVSASAQRGTNGSIGSGESPRSALFTTSVRTVTNEAPAAMYPISSTLPVNTVSATNNTKPGTTVRLLTILFLLFSGVIARTDPLDIETEYSRSADDWP